MCVREAESLVSLRECRLTSAPRRHLEASDELESLDAPLERVCPRSLVVIGACCCCFSFRRQADGKHGRKAGAGLTYEGSRKQGAGGANLGDDDDDDDDAVDHHRG